MAVARPKLGPAVRKSRTPPRTQRWGIPVLKSIPPPYCTAPLLVVPWVSEKCAQPPPAMTKGEIGLPGRSLSLSPGVTKVVDMWSKNADGDVAGHKPVVSDGARAT